MRLQRAVMPSSKQWRGARWIVSQASSLSHGQKPLRHSNAAGPAAEGLFAHTIAAEIRSTNAACSNTEPAAQATHVVLAPTPLCRAPQGPGRLAAWQARQKVVGEVQMAEITGELCRCAQAVRCDTQSFANQPTCQFGVVVDGRKRQSVEAIELD